MIAEVNHPAIATSTATVTMDLRERERGNQLDCLRIVGSSEPIIDMEKFGS